MEAHLKVSEGGGHPAPRIYFDDDTAASPARCMSASPDPTTWFPRPVAEWTYAGTSPGAGGQQRPCPAKTAHRAGWLASWGRDCFRLRC